MGEREFNIAISGASGFVGSHLTHYFENAGYRVIALGRDAFAGQGERCLEELLSGCEIIIHLAGAPINHRWTKKYKQLLRDSRVQTTRRLVYAINHLATPPKLLISASAVGYYPSSGCHDEYNGKKGDGFLSDLCEQWEREARQISPLVRLAITRFGVVLSPEGGAFPRMVIPARWGISTILGTGKQVFPWIEINDLVRALAFIIEQPSLDGVINLVAPEQRTHRQFTETVARHYRSIFTVSVPETFLRLLLGEASSFIVNGQCVYPQKLLASGYVFNTPSIDKFCEKLSTE